MGGMTPTSKDDFFQLVREELGKMWDQIRTLQQPNGTSLVGLVQQVQEAVANIAANVGTAVTAYLSSGFTTGSMTATGNVDVAGNAGVGGDLEVGGALQVDGEANLGGLTSLGVYNTDVSALGGTRRTNWTHQSGVVGYAPSTVAKKTNIEPFPAPAAAFLECGARIFQYKAVIDIRDNPDNPNHDPTMEVPIEPGYLAEELIAAGLGMFVFTNDDGSPAGINYDYFAAVGFGVVGRDHEERIAQLEQERT